MPWQPEDAHDKTHKAKTPKEQRQWSHVADSVLEKTGDEERAIREANEVIRKGSAGAVGGVPSRFPPREPITESDGV